ncbi:MAG TPA: glycosyltransferase family 39 protein [Xanthobacteraceae bacterium]|nr:glycosyltransferase family 39 protein [Xanthobacteraceae bacterium]
MQDVAVNSLPFRTKAIGTAGRLDALALCVLAALTAIALLTFRDYGLGWDDYTHSQYGQLLVALYRSGFTDRRALSFVNLYMYGGGYDILATLAAKVLPLGLFETRRLVGALIGIVGLFVTWRLGRRLGGPFAGLAALVLLAACPLYYGHMFINAKDGPFATYMAVALLGIVRAFDEYPRASPATMALCGTGVGLAIGARVLGGFAVLEALLPLFFILAVRWRECGGRAAAAEMGTYLTPFIPAVIFAYLLMGLVWPWAVLSPFNPFHAVEYFSNFFEKPWRELFDGQINLVPDMPRSYVPTLMALKNPELMLGLGLVGIFGAGAAVLRGAKPAFGVGRRAALSAVLIATLLPMLITVAERPAMYNGIRHFVFTLPPLAVLGGMAAAWIARRLQRFGMAAVTAGALAAMAGIASPVVEMVRLHPYQYTYYNHLIGGVAGARSRYMVDYWGLSMTQASRRLRAWIKARDEKPPAGRPWKVAVCGPHPAVEVALGPKFSALWDPNGADFAMMLNEFYCAKLNAPVILQVVRDGVVYARVYDIRGLSVSSLLAYPSVN